MSYEWSSDVPIPIYVETDEEAEDLLYLLLLKYEKHPEEFIAFDTETHAMKVPIKGTKEKPASRDPLDWMRDTVTFWSLAARMNAKGVRGEWVRYLNKWHPENLVDDYGDKIDPDPYARWCFHQQHFSSFIPLLEKKGVKIATWNLKYDAHISYNSGVNIWCADPYDFLIAAHLLDENLQGRMSLKERANDWIGIHMSKFVDLFDKDKEGNKAIEFVTSLFDLPLDSVVHYASYDAYATLVLAEYLQHHLKLEVIDKDDGYTMWDHFVSTEVPLTKVLWRMERRGLGVKLEELERLDPIIKEEILKLEKDINRAAGRYVNINSPQQLVKLFFGSVSEGGKGLKPLKKTKGGAKGPQPSVDEEVLTKLAEDYDDKEAQRVLRCRKLYKIHGTYVTALRLMAAHHVDGRIHPSFNQHGAKTGRFSTSSPNCFDGDTEILTVRGWVRFIEYYHMKGTLVAQWDKETEHITFTTPLSVVAENYCGNMVFVENQHINLFMTPNHRCPIFTDSGVYKQYLAKDYPSTTNNLRQPQAGHYYGPGTLDWSDEYLGLVLATQADGSWHCGGIDFAFNKDRKAERLLMFLDSLGANYSYKHNPKLVTKKHRIRVKAGSLVDGLISLLGKERKLGPWLLDLSRDGLEFVGEELFFWDGCWERMSMYGCKDKENTDWAQIIMTLLGRRTKTRVYTPKNPNAKPSHQTDVTDRSYSHTINSKKTLVPWDDTVYCVTVPDDHILIRRKGRVSISCNSQNLPRPKGDEFGIRKLFIPKPGNVLIVSDYGQLEMRIMAHFSEDDNMVKAINDGMDLHCFTVSRMFPGVTYEEAEEADKEEDPTPRQELLKEMRQAAKAIGFGLIYGAGSKKIGQQLNIPKEEAQEKIDQYFDAFPGISEYISNTHDYCKRRGYVRTLSGRKRRLKDITHKNWMLRSFAEREAVNVTIQGSASDIAKAAMLMVEYDTALSDMGAEMLNQVHDELVIEIPARNAESAVPIIRYHMEFPFNGNPALIVPTPVDIHVVDNWAAAK